jgi:putative membrane protein
MFRQSLIAAALLIPAPALAAPDAHFLMDAIHGDYSEVTLGKLIQQRGSSAKVRDFGATLVTDHSKGLTEAEDLAKRLHMSISPAMAPEARTEQAKLQHLRGAAFDREVKRYMVQDHEKDIAEFKRQAKNGDKYTARFATATLPVLQKHLDIAKSLPG